MKRPEKSSKCRNCGKILDSHTDIKDESNTRPKPGDVTVCSYCGSISEFTKDLDLAPIAPETQIDICKEHPEVYDKLMKLRVAIQLFRKFNKETPS